MADRILLVEDERGLVMALEDRLQIEGYRVTARFDGPSGEREASTGRYDCIVLDVMLPERDGFQVCRNLRDSGVRTPILMLTARSTTIDTVMGLKIGADDYLSKPFEMQVLLARIEALIRRYRTNGTETRKHPVYRFGSCTLDTEQRCLLSENKEVELNAIEYRLLEYFLTHAGTVLTRQRLLDEVWGYDSETTTRTVDVHVARLRQKLNESEKPRFLLTIRGAGYKFNPNGTP
jgi:DNA-binding response OmpR family regulator